MRKWEEMVNEKRMRMTSVITYENGATLRVNFSIRGSNGRRFVCLLRLYLVGSKFSCSYSNINVGMSIPHVMLAVVGKI